MSANQTSTPKRQSTSEIDPQSSQLDLFLSLYDTPSRSWIEMADEEEELIRQHEQSIVHEVMEQEMVKKVEEKIVEKEDKIPAVEFVGNLNYVADKVDLFDFGYESRVAAVLSSVVAQSAQAIANEYSSVIENDTMVKRSRKISIPTKCNTKPKFERRNTRAFELSRKRKNENTDGTDPVGKRSNRSPSTSTDIPLQQLLPNPHCDWNTPNKGWCVDEKVAERKLVDILRAKDKPIYKRYLAAVPKDKRKQNEQGKVIDPKTPNRFVNCSRRSWDTQIRKWKKSLYEYFGEEPSPSCAGSICGSESESEIEDAQLQKGTTASSKTSVSSVSQTLTISTDSLDSTSTIDTMRSSTGPSNLVSIATPDNMASLLGHFDIDSRRFLMEEESTLQDSTLKAPIESDGQLKESKSDRPTDFSQMHTD